MHEQKFDDTLESGEREHPVEEDYSGSTTDSSDAKPAVSRIIRSGATVAPSVDEVAAETDSTSLDMKDVPSVLEQNRKADDRVLHSHHKRQRPSRGDALVGFLVSFDADSRGSFVELREGRMIVTSESVGAAPCLVLADSSVSPMHAIMKIVSGEPLHILDQLSEFGTRIWHSDSGHEERLAGEKGIARHGDVVYFGERKFHVCLVSIEIDDNE